MKAKMMAKLVVAAMAVALADGVGAASFEWLFSGVQPTGNELSATSKYTTYFFATSVSTTTFKDVKVTTLKEITNLLDAGQDVSSYASGSATSTYDEKTGTASFDGFVVSSSRAFSNGVTLSGFLLVLDAASVELASNYMVVKNSSGSSTLSWTSKSNNSTYPVKNNLGDVSANSPWLAIPEPTSGVLLALGIAALALRRKRYRVVA